MSKTNTEKMAPETQTPEMTNGMKLDVRVRPIAPMGNLLAFANVTIGGCFKIDGFRICSSEKGLYVNMPATQDKGGNWKDVCWPVTAEFRKQLNDALIDGYGQAIENLQATLEATKGAAEKPSLTGALKENAGKVKEQPATVSYTHLPDREDGGIPNPHFHVLCPIRPIEQNGKWGLKQRRVYELDEDGNRIRDANGKFVFNAVPTTDWGSPETLEHWRQTWAELCNAKFAEKGLDVRIDHRSYERQGVELLPTVHEGATVRAMEKKGIRTEKGEFNRWIRATNAVIRDIKKKIALLFDWIAEAKAELAKPQAPDLVSLLNAYYTQRRAGAYSQKGKVSNLKEMNETFNYLRANGIYTLEDLESRVSEHSAATESLKKTLDEQTARMKAIKQLYDLSLIHIWQENVRADHAALAGVVAVFAVILAIQSLPGSVGSRSDSGLSCASLSLRDAQMK